MKNQTQVMKNRRGFLGDNKWCKNIYKKIEDGVKSMLKHDSV